MRARLAMFMEIITPLIESAVMKLSIENFKKFLGRCFPSLKHQLSIAKSFDDIMEIAEEKCTIINICCFESIVDQYKIEEAKSHITSYKSAVEMFCEDLKLNVCKIVDMSRLLECNTIVFTLGWETNEWMHREISGLLSKAFSETGGKVEVKINERKLMNSMSYIIT